MATPKRPCGACSRASPASSWPTACSATCRTGRAGLPANFDLQSFELFELNFVDELSADEVARAHREFGARLERAFPPRFELRRERAARERRLRIGYVSSDFNYHPVGLFMLPAIEGHDRSHFE